MPVSDALKKQLDDLVSSNKVVLFMKGNRRSPQCGFSASVVGILDELLPSYETVDVLSSPELRDGIKLYSEWPTIPQLYIDGRFVGGSDIVKEMSASGDLAKALGATVAEVAPPTITITPAALTALRDAMEPGSDDLLRLEIDARFQPGLSFGPRAQGDLEVKASGMPLLLDRASAKRANGVSIDFVEGTDGAGFRIDNPNEPPRVKQLTVVELKAMLDKKESKNESFELVDVRTDHERTIAQIPGARQLDTAAQEHLMGLPRDTPIVFHCHHGGRSQQAAEAFLGRGFTKVYNVRGGIDAWSLTVDPSVARY
ncbi:MAG: Grx4 family monothiol glutaredoxin [Minicystis sp.]